MAQSLQRLLEGNVKWVEQTREKDPDFFNRLAAGQSPEFLWIGCSDSRVPATEITGTVPGSIFVQRNIANMVVYTDTNLLSVVYYALKYLRVKHIIVCGHYGCGGVKAAMSNERFGFLDNWLLNIKSVYRKHVEELHSITDESKRFDRLVELNTIEQVKNLAKISFIQEEWDNSQYPYIHAWVYDIRDGIIKDLNNTINSKDDLSDVFQYMPKAQVEV